MILPVTVAASAAVEVVNLMPSRPFLRIALLRSNCGRLDVPMVTWTPSDATPVFRSMMLPSMIYPAEVPIPGDALAVMRLDKMVVMPLTIIAPLVQPLVHPVISEFMIFPLFPVAAMLAIVQFLAVTWSIMFILLAKFIALVAELLAQSNEKFLNVAKLPGDEIMLIELPEDIWIVTVPPSPGVVVYPS